jgi:hypothetical protein
LAFGVALLAGALPISACAETATLPTYEPAKLEPLPGKEGVKRVRLTAEGARRTGLQTATVRRSGKHKLIPYEALLYDAGGRAYVYTSPEPLSFVRAEVRVDRIEGTRVLASDAPPVGTKVVTVGAAEVYGTELEIQGGH